MSVPIILRCTSSVAPALDSAFWYMFVAHDYELNAHFRNSQPATAASHSGVCEFLWSLSFAFLILSQVLRLRNDPIMLNTSGKWRLLLLLAFKGPKGLKERSFVLCSGISPLVPSANKNKACVPRATPHQALFVLEACENPSLVRH